MGKHGNTKVDFLDSEVSDHLASMIIVRKVKSFGSRPFKFFIYWFENVDFFNWVTKGWSLRLMECQCIDCMNS